MPNFIQVSTRVWSIRLVTPMCTDTQTECLNPLFRFTGGLKGFLYERIKLFFNKIFSNVHLTSFFTIKHVRHQSLSGSYLLINNILLYVNNINHFLKQQLIYDVYLRTSISNISIFIHNKHVDLLLIAFHQKYLNMPKGTMSAKLQKIRLSFNRHLGFNLP